MSNHQMKRLVDSILIMLEARLKKLFEIHKTEWMTTKEAAAYLRLSENNLRTKISRGQLKVHGKIGKSWRFRRDELDKLLSNPIKGIFND